MVENGRATLRPVTLTRRSGRLAAIASGLKPGEDVIVYPSDRVRAGVRVARGDMSGGYVLSGTIAVQPGYDDPTAASAMPHEAVTL